LKVINPKAVVMIGVIFVSFSSIFIKLSEAPSLIIASYRLIFTVLLITPSVVFRRREELKCVDRKSLILSIVSGIFLAFHFAAWITSIKYTSIASSTVLVNTHPIFIVIGSYLILKEKVSRKALIGMGITVLGSMIISFGDSSLGSNVLYGDLLAILGGLFVSGYMMIGRIVRQKMSMTSYTFIVYLTCSVTLVAIVLLTNTPLYPYPFKEWLIFLALAVFCTILGHSIFSWGLGYLKPTFISTAVLGEPVFAALWAIPLFHQYPPIWQIVGSLVIILGIYIFIQANDRSENNLNDKDLALE